MIGKFSNTFDLRMTKFDASVYVQTTEGIVVLCFHLDLGMHCYLGTLRRTMSIDLHCPNNADWTPSLGVVSGRWPIRKSWQSVGLVVVVVFSVCGILLVRARHCP